MRPAEGGELAERRREGLRDTGCDREARPPAAELGRLVVSAGPVLGDGLMAVTLWHGGVLLMVVVMGE